MATANLYCQGGATSDNTAYQRRSEYLAWASPHCGKRPPQRQVSKTLYESGAGMPET